MSLWSLGCQDPGLVVLPLLKFLFLIRCLCDRTHDFIASSCEISCGLPLLRRNLLSIGELRTRQYQSVQQFYVLTRFLYDPGLAAWIQLCKMSECVLKILMKPMPSLSLIRCNVKCYDLLRLRTWSKLFTFGYFLFARKSAVLLHTILSHGRKLTCTPDVHKQNSKTF